MIRQTGGSALAATSTRSRSCSRAMAQRLGQRLHAELLSVGADEQDLASADAVVDPGVVCGDVITSSAGTTRNDGGHGKSAIGRPSHHRSARWPPDGCGAVGTTNPELGPDTGAGRVGTIASSAVPLPCSVVKTAGYQREWPLDTVGRAPARAEPRNRSGADLGPPGRECRSGRRAHARGGGGGPGELRQLRGCSPPRRSSTSSPTTPSASGSSPSCICTPDDTAAAPNLGGGRPRHRRHRRARRRAGRPPRPARRARSATRSPSSASPSSRRAGAPSGDA